MTVSQNLLCRMPDPMSILWNQRPQQRATSTQTDMAWPANTSDADLSEEIWRRAKYVRQAACTALL